MFYSSSSSSSSSSSVIQISQSTPWGAQEHVVNTSFGPVSVFVSGDQSKPALITYPDIALNYMSCFQGLVFHPEAASLLFHNFCIYHIDAPGNEPHAAGIPLYEPFLTVEDLADQVNEVLDYFGLQRAMCMGVMAGAYILTLLALRHPERVHGLILISPLCRAPSWSEWAYNKLMVNVLYFYGMCSLVKDALLQRYFSQALLQNAESEIVEACRRLLDERQTGNIMRFIQAIHRRKDITGDLKKLGCRTLVFAGEHSAFYNEALHLAKEMNHSVVALVEVEGCGSLVTEEQPQAMLAPLEYFLTGYGLYRPLPILYPQQDYYYYYYNYHHSDHQDTTTTTTTTTGGISNNCNSAAAACGDDDHLIASTHQYSCYSSVVAPHCISPELLSPQSLGLNLKPIKTRSSQNV